MDLQYAHTNQGEKQFCIPESFNTTVSHQIFGYTIISDSDLVWFIQLIRLMLKLCFIGKDEYVNKI